MAQSLQGGSLDIGLAIAWLHGGLSGAQLARFATDEESIVLKRAPLAEIAEEAVNRRGRALDPRRGETHERERFLRLRNRGASHIAVDEDSGELYGIIAYEFVGRHPQERPSVSDLETLVRTRFVSPERPGQALPEDQLASTFDAVLVALFDRGPYQDDGVRLPGETSETGRVPRLYRTRDLAKSIELSLRTQQVAEYVEGLAQGENSLKKYQELFANLPTLQARVIEDNQRLDHGDSRYVHGDARLANILVDAHNADYVETIDYGEGGPGQHAFKDLARLEIDILLRATAVEGRPATEVEQRAQRLFATDAPAQSDDRALDIVRIWRASRDKRFDLSAARAIYWLFLLRELLKRVSWHADGNPDDAVGWTLTEVLEAIRVLVDNAP